MEKHIYNEQTDISYTLHGDYYLPDLTLPEAENAPEIGLWWAKTSATYQAAQKGVIPQFNDYRKAL